MESKRSLVNDANISADSEFTGAYENTIYQHISYSIIIKTLLLKAFAERSRNN